MEITHTLPKYQTHKNHGDSKHNPSHVQRHTLPSQLLITQFRLNTHNPSQVLQHQKQTQYFMLQNKNLFLKTPFDLRHLTTSSSSSFYFSQPSEGNYTLSEETTQRKYTYITTIFLANNKLSLATNNKNLQLKSSYKNCGYKMVPPR